MLRNERLPLPPPSSLQNFVQVVKHAGCVLTRSASMLGVQCLLLCRSRVGTTSDLLSPLLGHRGFLAGRTGTEVAGGVARHPARPRFCCPSRRPPFRQHGVGGVSAYSLPTSMAAAKTAGCRMVQRLDKQPRQQCWCVVGIGRLMTGMHKPLRAACLETAGHSHPRLPVLC